MGIFWVADYDSEIRIGKFKIWCQNCKIRNGGSKMAAILVQILSFFAMKIKNVGDVGVNRKCFGNYYETWHTGIFRIADCDSDISITKLFSLSA